MLIFPSGHNSDTTTMTSTWCPKILKENSSLSLIIVFPPMIIYRSHKKNHRAIGSCLSYSLIRRWRMAKGFAAPVRLASSAWRWDAVHHSLDGKNQKPVVWIKRSSSDLLVGGTWYREVVHETFTMFLWFFLGKFKTGAWITRGELSQWNQRALASRNHVIFHLRMLKKNLMLVGGLEHLLFFHCFPYIWE